MDDNGFGAASSGHARSFDERSVFGVSRTTNLSSIPLSSAMWSAVLRAALTQSPSSCLCSGSTRSMLTLLMMKEMFDQLELVRGDKKIGCVTARPWMTMPWWSSPTHATACRWVSAACAAEFMDDSVSRIAVIVWVWLFVIFIFYFIHMFTFVWCVVWVWCRFCFASACFCPPFAFELMN